MEFEKLERSAKNIRKNLLKAICEAGSGHPGGSLSAVEILTYLYFCEMKVDEKNPLWDGRDRFVLSKGHAAPVLYATLGERGFFAIDEIMSLRKIGGNFQGHPCRDKVPGVEMSTGSLGQGLSAANGMAISAKIYGNDYRVYAILGDGELQEGQIWEAAMTAAHYKLDNVVAIVDYNNLQIDGKVSDVMDVSPVADKFKAFNWHVIEIDGHNYDEIIKAFAEARTVKGKPTVIVANTVKGKGVSFMENNAGFHGAAPNDEEYKKAMEELQ